MSFVVGKKKEIRSVKIDPDVLSWSETFLYGRGQCVVSSGVK